MILEKKAICRLIYVHFDTTNAQNKLSWRDILLSNFCTANFSISESNKKLQQHNVRRRRETAFRWPCCTEINASFYAAPICFYLEIDFPFHRRDFNHARTMLMNARDRDVILSSEKFVHSLITNAYEIQILTDVVL